MQEVTSHWTLLECKLIAKYVAACEDERSVRLIYEYCAQGELAVYLARKTAVSNRDVADISVQLFKALKHCHSKGIS